MHRTAAVLFAPLLMSTSGIWSVHTKIMTVQSFSILFIYFHKQTKNMQIKYIFKNKNVKSIKNKAI